jgi:hypothetical protein
MVLSLPLLVLLAVEPASGGTAGAMPGTDEINRACDAAQKFADSHQSKALNVADVSEAILPKKGQGTWRVFKSRKEMERAGDEGSPNSQARVWVTPGAGIFEARRPAILGRHPGQAN